jgi:hypothetical protein
MTALCVAFWATFLLVLVDHVSKQCLLYAVGCAISSFSSIEDVKNCQNRRGFRQKNASIEETLFTLPLEPRLVKQKSP